MHGNARRQFHDRQEWPHTNGVLARNTRGGAIPVDNSPFAPAEPLVMRSGFAQPRGNPHPQDSYRHRRDNAGPENRYRGHLQADVYAAFNAFFVRPERGIVEVGCWAHARRHFHQALESDSSRMRTVLLLIAELYGIERSAQERGLSSAVGRAN